MDSNKPKNKTKAKYKSKGRKLTSGQLEGAIIKLMRDNPKKQYNPRQIVKRLKIKNTKDSVNAVMENMAKANKLISLGDYKYKAKRGAGSSNGRSSRSTKMVQGIVDMTRQGSAYIASEGREQDIFVSSKNLGTAMHGDLVQVRHWVPRGRRKPEGEVMKVLERATEQFVGTLWLHKRNAYVVPSRDNIPFDVYVDLEDLNGAEDGDRVVVKVVKWHQRPTAKPVGVVTAVLGMEGSDLEMNVILINNGFNLVHDPAAVAEAEELSEEISIQEIHRRRDFREITTFTIDPEDAKDFDDALSIRFLDNGHTEIGVHIADVTHYVRPNSVLDQEAYKRSTSVYLVDRVLPMLPERLSNNLCSLRPNEDRLTFSAVFEFDKNFKIIDRWFGKGVIHSDKRFAYEGAQIVLENGIGEFSDELKLINKIAKRLRKNRFKHGAIDFDMEEVRFRLDEEGVPIEVYVKDRKDAHLLIEEFMLLANREVATFINKKAEGQQEIPFVYRIHDQPDPDKVAELASFAKELGFEMKIGSPKDIAKSFNRLAKASEKDPMLKLLQPLAIRTMAKAEYSANNIGHYGLAFDYYSHFTSPIRRYSDVIAHRILEKNLNEATFRVDKTRLEEKCKHISLQERKAMDAERESIKYKQVEFMSKHVGQIFDGIISGMIDRGIFVELRDNKCEGMVGFESMKESFNLENGRLRAKGTSTGRTLKMGDPVKVKILGTNLAKRQIEMELVDEGW